MAAAFALASLFVAFVMLREFLRNASGHWSQWPTFGGLAWNLAAFLCSGFPYATILWNLGRGPSSGKGSFQAVAMGSFWFLLGTSLLIFSVFELPTASPTEMRKQAGEMFEVVVVSAALFTLPGLLFLTGALKVSRSVGGGLLACTIPGQAPGLRVARLGVGITLLLFTSVAVLSVFVVRPLLAGLRFFTIEALLVVGSLPYASVFQRLCRRGEDREALTLGCGLAVGCLTNLILGGGVGVLLALDKHWGQSRYEGAELAFFSLLALSNLLMLRNGLRLRQSSTTPPLEALSWWSILVTPVSLVVFLSVIVVYSFSV
jgi:hypothetical protein